MADAKYKKRMTEKKRKAVNEMVGNAISSSISNVSDALAYVGTSGRTERLAGRQEERRNREFERLDLIYKQTASEIGYNVFPDNESASAPVKHQSLPRAISSHRKAKTHVYA